MKRLLVTTMMIHLAAGTILYAQAPDARRLGKEVLYEALLGAKKFVIVVESNGCTNRGSFEVKAERKSGLDGPEHYIFTVNRVRRDDCKMVPHREIILFDIEKDLGINGDYTFSLSNGVYASLPADDSLLAIVEKYFTYKNTGIEEAQVREEEGFMPAFKKHLEEKELEIRTGLKNAMLYAIRSEIARYEKTGDKKKIGGLMADLEKIQGLKPQEIALPEVGEPDEEIDIPDPAGFGLVIPPLVKEVRISVKSPYRAGMILEIEGMTKSGPFYHIAGIQGDDLSLLRPGQDLRLSLCLIYKRQYFGFIPDYYVYIARVDAIKKSRQ